MHLILQALGGAISTFSFRSGWNHVGTSSFFFFFFFVHCVLRDFSTDNPSLIFSWSFVGHILVFTSKCLWPCFHTTTIPVSVFQCSCVLCVLPLVRQRFGSDVPAPSCGIGNKNEKMINEKKKTSAHETVNTMWHLIPQIVLQHGRRSSRRGLISPPPTPLPLSISQL